MHPLRNICASRSFRVFQIVFVGLLFMNADCPPPDGNTNVNSNNNNNNNNSNDNTSVVEVPDNNVLGFSAAIVTAISFPNPEILVYENPTTIDGNAAPSLTIDAPDNNRVLGLDINSAGELMVLNPSGVFIYASADDITNSTPSRNVPSPAGFILQMMVLDRGRDLLYVWGDDTQPNPTLFVYEKVSEPDFDGAIEPFHTITNPVLSERKMNSFTISPDNRMYVLTQTDSPQKMVVFDDAASLDGEVTEKHLVDFTEFQTDQDTLLAVPTVDADDNLIMEGLRKVGGNLQLGIVSIADASTLNGEVTGTAFLDITAQGTPFWLTVHHGTAFVSQQANIAIYNDIAGRDGTPTPDRNVTGDMTELFAPKPLLVFE